MLAISVAAALTTLTGLVLGCLFILLPVTQAQSVADEAALAAADSASGRVPGYPCERAAGVVSSASLVLIECRVDRQISRIIVGLNVLGIDVKRRAQAGPPRQMVYGSGMQVYK